MPDLPTVDRSKRRRRVIAAASAMLVIVVFAAIGAVFPHREALRAVDVVRIVALIAFTFVVAIRSTTNFGFGPRNPELDDELSRANRASAAFQGFWAMLLSATGAYLASFFLDLRLTEAAPIILCAGAVAAGWRFAYLEAVGEEVV